MLPLWEAAVIPVGQRISLQNVISLSVLLIGLLAGILGLGYTYWQLKDTHRTSLGLYFQELAHHSADKVALVMAKEVEMVERLSALPQVKKAVEGRRRLTLDVPVLNQWLEAQHEFFRALAIVDREGRLVGGVTSETTRVHYARQPWWPHVFGQKRPWAGDLLADEKGRGYWEVAVPIESEDGEVVGVVRVAIGTDELFASVLRTRFGQTGHLMILDHGGRVLACPVLPPTLHKKTDALSTGLGSAGQEPLGAVWAEVREDSHGSGGGIVGIAPVALPFPITQERVWHILVRQDPEETYGPARTLMWKLAGFWVGAIGLIALAGSLVARRIVQPLEILVSRVRLLGEGQLTQRLESGREFSLPEIETLKTSFNRMTERLQAAAEETRRFVQQLETANRELATSEAHYRTLWDHAVDPMLIVGATGLVRDVNQRASLMLGWRAEEVVGAAAADLFEPRDRGRFCELLRRVQERGKAGPAAEMEVSTAAGAKRTMELEMVPMETTGAETVVLLQLTDITEKRQLERELIRSERIASLSQFASMLAHDVQNPLAGIKKTLELMVPRSEFQAEAVRRHFKDLQFTTDLLLSMINDMLDVSQESYSGLPLIYSSFSVGALLQEVAQLFKLEAEANHVTIRVVAPEPDLIITGDRRRLQRVGINLVHNALKYAPPGSAVGLFAAPVRDRKPGDPWDPLEGPVLLIRVEDEGPGVDPRELPRIFEMFFRKPEDKGRRAGRGLGLYFCRMVVEAHQGRIWAGNRPTGGAVFSVALPLKGSEGCPSAS